MDKMSLRPDEMMSQVVKWLRGPKFGDSCSEVPKLWFSRSNQASFKRE